TPKWCRQPCSWSPRRRRWCSCAEEAPAARLTRSVVPTPTASRRIERRKDLLETLKRGWWLLVLRGVLAIAFGILAFVKPNITLGALVIVFGAYALVTGLVVLGLALRAPKGTPGKGWLVFLGLISAAAGVLTFFYPGVTALSLLVVI